MIRKTISTALFATMLISAGSAAALTPAANAGRNVTRVVNTGSISSLTTNALVDIEYKTGAEVKVTLTAPENVIDMITVTNDGGNLTVSTTDKFNFEKGKKDVYKLSVTAPGVSSFTTMSSGDIKILSNLSGITNLKLQTLSSGDIDARNVDCNNFSAMCGSSGDIELKSVTAYNIECNSVSSGDIEIEAISGDKAVLSTASSGNVEVGTVECTNASVCSKSSGDISLKAVNVDRISLTTKSSGNISVKDISAKFADISIESSGDIFMTGNCEDVNIKETSSGRLRSQAGKKSK